MSAAICGPPSPPDKTGYADVAPIDGVIFASGGQRLEVSVSVTPVE